MAPAPRVRLETSMGNFVVELYVDHAPRTCHNFIELSRRCDAACTHALARVSA